MFGSSATLGDELSVLWNQLIGGRPIGYFSKKKVPEFAAILLILGGIFFMFAGQGLQGVSNLLQKVQGEMPIVQRPSNAPISSGKRLSQPRLVGQLSGSQDMTTGSFAIRSGLFKVTYSCGMTKPQIGGNRNPSPARSGFRLFAR